MKDVSSLAQNLDLIHLGSKRIYLVGTAHVSETSARLTEEVIREHKPDTVCLELCPARYESLRDPDRWRNTDVVKVIREGKAYVLLAQLVLATFQRKLAKQFNIKPGQEMLSAIAEAEAIGAKIELVDREVKTTLRRAWAGASFLSVVRMLFSFVASIFDQEEIKKEEIERLKESDVMTAVMEEFSQYLPGVKTGLIDERDLYMAAKIAAAPGERIVAVVGAGHVPGIKRALGETIDITELEKIPSPRFLTRVFQWGIPVIFVAALVLGFFHSGGDFTWSLIQTWVLTTGTGAAIGALVALGHPLTALSAFVAAPFTTLHPLIAVGAVSGFVEAWTRKPQVKDFENLGEELQTLSGWWRNRVSRILVVFVLSNLGATLGAVFGGTKVVALFLQ